MTARCVLPLLAALLSGCQRGVPFVRANNLRHAAGIARDSVVTVSLVATHARWRPDADDGPWVYVDAFAEEGKSPSVPGPLIRVPPNGRIDLTIRNTFRDTLLVLGFGRRAPGFAGDTIRVAPGSSRRQSVRAPAAGTGAYIGIVKGAGEPLMGGGGRQLVGVLQVGEPRPGERLLGMNIFQAFFDSTAAKPVDRVFWAINGKMWPRTERFAFDVGDSVRWRIVDLTADEHPMHLHGFYFRVDGRSTWDTDSVYTDAQRRLAVTEAPPPGGSMAITWVPTRPGAWLFHCHKVVHMSGDLHGYLAGDTATPPMPTHVSAAEHLKTGMGGLIVGIEVRGNPPVIDTASAGVRRIRLVAQRHAGYFGRMPAYGYVVQDGAEPAADSVRIPGPVLVLTRGEPVIITVVNRLPYMTTVHWHGIELESYYDGVAGWSGTPGHTAPTVAPGDSFVVRMRPPRSGTFMYHTHVSEPRQVAGGLVGALLVVEPGHAWDPRTDHVVLVHEMTDGDSSLVVYNGRVRAAPLELTAGIANRLRFITLVLDNRADVRLLARGGEARWRPVAKDGADLPDARVVPVPARAHLLPGETYDVVLTPTRADTAIEVRSFNTFHIPIHVR